MRRVNGHAQLAVYIRGYGAHFKIAGASADNQLRQDADAQIMLYHGEDGKIIVHRIFDVRMDIVFFQNLVNVSVVCIFADDERGILE